MTPLDARPSSPGPSRLAVVVPRLQLEALFRELVQAGEVSLAAALGVVLVDLGQLEKRLAQRAEVDGGTRGA